MKKVKDMIINFVNGFCMALADSVPGVSGGTIAFLLGFYDNFIGSLDNLFRGNKEEKKSALKYLIKLGIGWIVGFTISIAILADIFEVQIYNVSSLFLGFIIFAIPIVIYEEKETLKGKWKEMLFVLLGIAVVVAISLINPASGTGIDVSMQGLNLGLIIYVFIAAMIAITAMVLPGISGSTLLLIFGLYLPIIGALKELMHMNFSYLPVVLIFILGVIAGIVLCVRLIRKALEKYRAQTVYCIIGLMLGSLYSIVIGTTTLDVPKDPMSFATFSILFFLIGGVVILGLQGLKVLMTRNQEKNDLKVKEND